MAIGSKLTIMDVSGPFREPREQAFSYDYSILRSDWPLPHAVRRGTGASGGAARVEPSLAGAS